MGFIGGFFIVVAVVIVFVAAIVGVICKIKRGEPLFGSQDDRKKILKHIVIVFAVIGVITVLPYVSAVIWALLRLVG